MYQKILEILDLLHFSYFSFISMQTVLSKGKLTVGKVYAGLLILENWKSTRFGKIPGTNALVSYISFLFCCKLLVIIKLQYRQSFQCIFLINIYYFQMKFLRSINNICIYSMFDLEDKKVCLGE